MKKLSAAMSSYELYYRECASLHFTRIVVVNSIVILTLGSVFETFYNRDVMTGFVA